MQDCRHSETDRSCRQASLCRGPLAGDARSRERSLVARKRAPTAPGQVRQEDGRGIAAAMHEAGPAAEGCLAKMASGHDCLTARTGGAAMAGMIVKAVTGDYWAFLQADIRPVRR